MLFALLLMYAFLTPLSAIAAAGSDFSGVIVEGPQAGTAVFGLATGETSAKVAGMWR